RRPGVLASMKVSSPRIYGLDDFRLSPPALKRLGARPVGISIQQRGPALSRLIPLRPKQREKRMREKLQAGLRRLRRRCPDAGITARGNGRLPWTLDAVLPAAVVARIAAEPGVEHVFVNKVRGLRPKRAASRPGLFCVWGSIAIQVEGRTR